MENSLSKITETASKAFEKAGELIQDRLFSPMYFYFLISWIVANWKFVYTFFFVDEETILKTQQILKVDYMAQMYHLDITSVIHLFIIPAISSFVFVWWISLISNKFYRKHEENQMEKRAVLREIEYKEKVRLAKSERTIREAESDIGVKYGENEEFNDFLDDGGEKVIVAGIEMLPSEVLYNTDRKAYVDQLNSWIDEQVQMAADIAVQQEIDKRRGK